MEAPGDATPFLPPRRSLKALRDAAASCRGCHLWRPAAQTVFGGGPRKARMMLVGEVPGDCEDREGHPFVGPAGRELDSALQAAGIDRASTYVTNVVKHFYFEERGKRRIHQRPDARAIKACRPWFDAELDVVGPEALVILGATAGKALLGSKFRLTDQRGRPLESDLAPPRREQPLSTFVRVSPGSTLAQGGARAQVGAGWHRRQAPQFRPQRA